MKKTSFEETYKKCAQKHGIVARRDEFYKLWMAVAAGKNVIIEGPVGVGKTVLASAIADSMNQKIIRVDGDSRFTEQKLTGWFDPSLVLKKGYSAKTFIEGPLVSAMKSGAILFINELNRMPEAVQNVLLPAIDEGLIQVPQLGEIRAKEGFLVIATQNPREFVATSHLSEALLDRMEWVRLDYQSFDEEKKIVKTRVKNAEEPFLTWAVGIVRLTRTHPKIKRGASIRAAISILQILDGLKKHGKVDEEMFFQAVKLALPTRIEIHSADAEGNIDVQIEILVKELMEELKKNSKNQTASLSH